MTSRLAMSAVGALYIGDTGNATIRKLAADGSLATTAGDVGDSVYAADEQQRRPAVFPD
jgi:hypothetical protein